MKTKGFWVIKTSAGGYWCSGGFDPQIRKAHVYTWKEKAEEAIETFIRRKYFPDEITYEVVAISEPKELKDTEAQWDFTIKGYAQCTNCKTSFETLPTVFAFKANNSYCRNCGKRMINSNTPED